MIAIKSLIFNLHFFLVSGALALICMIFLLFPARYMRKAERLWAWSIMSAAKGLLGIKHEIRGLDNLPGKGAIIACKHQSAWDTMIFFLLRPNSVYVLKKELTQIPIFGWCVGKAGNIVVDRNAGAQALKSLVKDTQAALDAGLNVVIFPEGTRIKAGTTGTYHPGIAALYGKIDAPVIPVALNSGVLWGRRSFLKKPGKITMEFLPPIPSGLKRREFMAELERTIEERTRTLEAEAAEASIARPQAMNS